MTPEEVSAVLSEAAQAGALVRDGTVLSQSPEELVPPATPSVGPPPLLSNHVK